MSGHFIVRHWLFLTGVAGVLLSAVGMVFASKIFNHYGVDYFDYASIENFIVAAFPAIKIIAKNHYVILYFSVWALLFLIFEIVAGTRRARIRSEIRNLRNSVETISIEGESTYAAIIAQKENRRNEVERKESELIKIEQSQDSDLALFNTLAAILAFVLVMALPMDQAVSEKTDDIRDSSPVKVRFLSPSANLGAPTPSTRYSDDSKEFILHFVGTSGPMSIFLENLEYYPAYVERVGEEGAKRQFDFVVRIIPSQWIEIIQAVPRSTMGHPRSLERPPADKPATGE